MDDEKFLIQLQDCFTAGYTMPQFCIDNGIKRPLFVGINESQKNFLWNLHVQFQYDRRLVAEFALLNGKMNDIYLAFGVGHISKMQLKNVDELNVQNYDKIIILANDNLSNERILYLKPLVEYFIKRTYAEIPFLNFLQKNPGVKLIQINSPVLSKHDNNNELEKKILDEKYTARGLKKRIEEAQLKGETIQTPYDILGYSNEVVYKLLSDPGQKINIDKSVTLNDDEFLGIKNGDRITVCQPSNYKNKIFFVAGCIYYGYGVPYDKTVCSHLQKILNKNSLPYRVENKSRFIINRQQDALYTLNSISVNPGDIVFAYLNNTEHLNHIPFLDVRNILHRPHNYGEVFADIGGHINENGHRAVADYIFKVLVENNFFKDFNFNYPPAPPPVHRYGIPKENFTSPKNFSQNKELEEYKAKLREKRFQVGAIVMNCNPFTLGHEYLIEYASKKVKKLYVFVVEEDKSEFKFADRFKLVQAGTKKFSNVEVLPSGKFIISQQTFSGYFNKENLQDVAVDSSEDVEIFAREIAPTLGITIRFVGEELEDSVTRQYNENMRNILPQYNIDFCEIPRREINGGIISAKKVREALKLGDFDTIKKLVPNTTLKFLRENFS